MKKIRTKSRFAVFFILFALASGIFLNSQNNSSDNLLGKVFLFPENTIGLLFTAHDLDIVDTGNSNVRVIETLPLTYRYDSGLRFVTIATQPRKLELPQLFSKKVTTWLALTDSKDVLLLFSGDRTPMVYGPIATHQIQDLFGDGHNYVASSELREGSTTYFASNLGNREIGEPWVPDDHHDGIGQELVITADGNRDKRHNAHQNYDYFVTGFWISIGFVSFDKPYLYKYNSRPRSIQISDPDTGISAKFDLKDTPDLQFIEFEKPSKKFHLKILESYHGSKYHDLCINTIITRVKTVWK